MLDYQYFLKGIEHLQKHYSMTYLDAERLQVIYEIINQQTNRNDYKQSILAIINNNEEIKQETNIANLISLYLPNTCDSSDSLAQVIAEEPRCREKAYSAEFEWFYSDCIDVAKSKYDEWLPNKQDCEKYWRMIQKQTIYEAT